MSWLSRIVLALLASTVLAQRCVAEVSLFEYKSPRGSPELTIKITRPLGAAYIQILFRTPELKDGPVFELENPPRLVVDMQGSTHAILKRFALSNIPRIRSLRLGSHPDKVRAVLDLERSIADQYEVIRQDGMIELRIRTEERQSEQPLSSSSSPSSEPVRSTSVQRSSQASSSLASSSQLSKTAQLLRGVTFDYVNQAPIIRLSLTQRPQFVLTKKDPRQYRLTIPNANQERESLSLPQFPPQDFVGFAFVQSSVGKNKLEIMIGVDRGARLRAYAQENDIILQIETRGRKQ